MTRIFTYLIFSLLSTGVSAQTTLMLPASADNTIYSELQQNSNGSGNNFTAGKTGPNAGNSIRRALVKFDLSGIPPGTVITSATLRLVMNTSRSGTDIVSVYKVLTDWGEGASAASEPDGVGAAAQVMDATWLCGKFNGAAGCTVPWGTAGGDFNAIPTASISIPNVPGPYGWTGLDIRADVQSWVNSPATNFGWLLRSNEAGSQTVNRFSSRTHPTVADRPILTVTYNFAAPVALSSFKGSESRSGILLDWETQTEVNNNFFQVQHSRDGITFTAIGQVKGGGTTSSTKKYQFNHAGVVEGIQYYRLVQTDFDGSKHTSNVITVNAKNRHIKLTFSPNPASDVLNLNFTGSGEEYKIFNMTGALVGSGKLVNDKVPLTKLTPGYYLIRVNVAGGESAVGSFQKR